jgi:hypothetical protein
MLKTPLLLMHITTLRTRFSKGTLWSLATALTLCSVASSQNGKPRDIWDNPSAKFRCAARDPLPITDLPKQMRAAEGKLTLWADYDSADQTSVPLYLVNRTGKEISLHSQDHDLGIKLEFKKEGGEWTRAQSHIFSDCGNSYYPVKLPADHFFELRGYRAAQGKQYPVRYAFSNNGSKLNSNTGEGLVSPEDLSTVERDGLTLQKIPYPIYDAIDSYSHGHATPAGLGECMAVLPILPLFERNEALLDKVRALRESLTKGPDTAEVAEAIQAIDKVLSHEWPSDSSAFAPITQLCFQSVLDVPETREGRSKIPEHIAWRILANEASNYQRLGSKGNPEDLKVWQPVLAKAEQTLQEPGTAPLKKGPAQTILVTGALVEALVPDTTVIGWLKSPHKELQRPGAAALVRRGKIPELLQLAWGLAPEAQISVLGVLPSMQRAAPTAERNLPLPPSEEERRFWTHCFSTHPLESTWVGFSGGVRMGDAVRLPLRDFLAREATAGSTTEKEFPLDEQRLYSLPLAIRLLNNFNNAEDDSLLHDLTRHRGTSPRTSYNSNGEIIGETALVVAEEANAALKQRDQASQAKATGR